MNLWSPRNCFIRDSYLCILVTSPRVKQCMMIINFVVEQLEEIKIMAFEVYKWQICRALKIICSS
jgi:hypothetical protein